MKQLQKQKTENWKGSSTWQRDLETGNFVMLFQEQGQN